MSTEGILRTVVLRHTVVGGYPDTAAIARDAFALGAQSEAKLTVEQIGLLHLIADNPRTLDDVRQAIRAALGEIGPGPSRQARIDVALHVYDNAPIGFSGAEIAESMRDALRAENHEALAKVEAEIMGEAEEKEDGPTRVFRCGGCGFYHPADREVDCLNPARRFTREQLTDFFGNEGSGWTEEEN